MKQHQLSAVKRLTKPILFGTLIVGLATAFFNRWLNMSLDPYPVLDGVLPIHRFFEDLAEMRAQERAKNDAKLMEVLEMRKRQMEELAEKKKP